MSDPKNTTFGGAMIAKQFMEAAEIAQRQLSQLEHTTGRSTRDYCLALLDAATADRVLGDHATSVTKLEQAVTTLKLLAPLSKDDQQELARCLGSLGVAYLHLNNIHAAEAALSESLTLISSMPTHSVSSTWLASRIYLSMADVCAKRKDWVGASRRLIESIRYSRPRQRGEPGLYCEGLMRLGQVYARLGRHADAEKLIRRAIYTLLGEPNYDPLFYAWLISTLGSVLLKRGDHTGAAALREEALDIVHKLRPEDDALVSRVETYFRIEPEPPVVADHAGG